MRTSFHHQPEAQHPNFPLSTSCRPITPSLAHFADPSRASREVRERRPWPQRPIAVRKRNERRVRIAYSITLSDEHAVLVDHLVGARK